MTTNTLASRIVATGKRDSHVTRLIVLFLIIVVFFALIKPEGFTSMRTWQSMGFQFPEFGLMALGVMLAMITGGIDLSVVGIANMASISAAVLMLSMTPEGATGSQVATAITVSMLVALVVGGVAGALNGFLVAIVKIPPILVTLGTLELFTGIAIIITEGKPVSGLPSQYGEVFAGKLFGVIPMPLVIFTIAAIIIGLLMALTTYGTKLRLLGTNSTAARLSGLNSTALLIKTYTISGLTAATAGLVMLANYNSAKADYGSTYTLLTVLIVVLGGVNPNGGRGRIIGVIFAILTLQILSSGLNMFPSISNFYRPLIWGSVLLIVIVADHISKDGSLKLPFRKQEKTNANG